MRFGIFSELQLPRPWRRRQRAGAVPPGARPARDRRPARLRLRVAGGAPLPRGVQPQLRARGLPRRARASAPSASASVTASCSSPPTTRRVSRSGSRPSTSSATAASSSASARVRPPRSCTRSTAASATSARCGRTRCAASCRCSAEERCEYHGEWFDFPRRNVVPKPVQTPAPAAVGRVQPAGDDRDGRAPWPGCARVPVRVRRSGARVGEPLLPHVRGRARAPRRLRHESEHRARVRLHVRADRRGGDRRAPTAGRSSSSRCASTAPPSRPRRSNACPPTELWQEYLAWRESPEGRATQRSHALIGSPATLRERLRKWEATHVDQIILLNQAGMTRHEHIVREPRAVRPRGACPSSTTASRRTRRGSGRSSRARPRSTTSTCSRTSRPAARAACPGPTGPEYPAAVRYCVGIEPAKTIPRRRATGANPKAGRSARDAPRDQRRDGRSRVPVPAEPPRPPGGGGLRGDPDRRRPLPTLREHGGAGLSNARGNWCRAGAHHA